MFSGWRLRFWFSATPRGIKLDVAAHVRQDVTLAVGQLNDSVTVEANPVRVDTANGTVDAVITQEQIQTAVLNGRHYARLAMLMPGAVDKPGHREFRPHYQRA